MEKKRPSLITVMVVLGVVVLVIVAVLILLNTSSKISKDDLSASATRLSNISGEENVVVDSSGLRTNTSKYLNEKKVVGDFEFSSFDVYSIDGKTTITFEIYNTKEEKANLGAYELKILDVNENLAGRVTGETDFIEGLSRKEVSFEIDGDIANLLDIQINKIVYEQV